MTNLEWLKENLTKEEKSKVQMCVAVNEKLYKDTCNGINCYDCPINKVGDLIDFLLLEHKEPIKLKKWEHDLIKIDFLLSQDNYFKASVICMELKKAGYFKGITDTSMKIEYILKNCEVIE